MEFTKLNVGDLRFRQLYVNGMRALRSRSQTSNFIEWDTYNKVIAINANSIRNWNNFEQVEIHTTRSWDIYQFRI